MDIKTERQNKITHIGQLLPEQLQKPVPFEWVELTPDEREHAVKEAMMKKHARLEDERRKHLAQQKFQELSTPWRADELYEHARIRATVIIRAERNDMSAVFEPMDFQKD